MDWLKNLFKQEHKHEFKLDYHSKNATIYYCDKCPQLSLRYRSNMNQEHLVEPIITDFDRKGNWINR